MGTGEGERHVAAHRVAGQHRGAGVDGARAREVVGVGGDRDLAGSGGLCRARAGRASTRWAGANAATCAPRPGG